MYKNFSKVFREGYEAFEGPVIGELERQCINDSIDSPSFTDYVCSMNKCASELLGRQCSIDEKDKDKIFSSFATVQTDIACKWYDQRCRHRELDDLDPFMTFVREVYKYVKMVKEGK
jgi:hypothetical protein